MVESEYAETFTVEVRVDPSTGRVLRERWRNLRGELDRLGDMPADIEYCPETGVQTSAGWFRQGLLHRSDDKPAGIGTDPKTGVIVFEQYVVSGAEHRAGGKPAVIERDGKSGNVTLLQYRENGVPHRLGGAAEEYFNAESGELEGQEYWIEGRQLSPSAGEPAAPEPF